MRGFPSLFGDRGTHRKDCIPVYNANLIKIRVAPANERQPI